MPNFVDTYAPASIDDVVFHDSAVKEDLLQYFRSAPTSPLILHGSYGVGKSEVAKLAPYIISPGIDANLVHDVIAKYSDTETEVLKKMEQSFNLWAFGNGKIPVVIDEFDNYQKQLQRSFKGALDKYRKWAHIVMTTNNLDKIDPGIRSRSKIVELRMPKREQWVERFSKICFAESVPVPDTEDIIDMLARAEDGRGVLNVIEKYVLAVKT